MATEFQSSGLSRWIPDRKRAEGIKAMHKFADEYVTEAIARHNNPTIDVEKNEKAERYVFLHALVKHTQDPCVLRSELLNVLLAGRDTTAGLLANTWWVLARRPDVWNKLLAEIDEHCPGGKRPDYTVIKEMKYLKYVLNESLRLMPVVPSNGRCAERDNVLPVGGGPDGRAPLFVAAGTNVGYSLWSMHRRKDFYGEDADEFKPERWEHLRPGWEYLPFNGGPRICLGQQFALLEASYATVRLMQRFPTCEARDARPWSEWITLTLASGPGTKVALFEK